MAEEVNPPKRPRGGRWIDELIEPFHYDGGEDTSKPTSTVLPTPAQYLELEEKSRNLRFDYVKAAMGECVPLTMRISAHERLWCFICLVMSTGYPWRWTYMELSILRTMFSDENIADLVLCQARVLRDLCKMLGVPDDTFHCKGDLSAGERLYKLVFPAEDNGSRRLGLTASPKFLNQTFRRVVRSDGNDNGA